MKTQPCPHCQHPIPQRKLRFCPVCGLSLKTTPTRELSVDPENYAHLGARLLARAIDYTILGILVCLIDWLTGGAFLKGIELFGYGLSHIAHVQYTLALGIILFLGYFVIFQSLCGQTPGKHICRVVVLRKGRQIPGIIQNIFRELGVWFTFMTGGWLFLIYFFSPRHKGLHDFLSGVEVYSLFQPPQD